ncbi:hypothetical protein DERP_012383 [Dermatophagoides pteronyssinus]|uniref:Uncharacterized protein n=1 Tax=Dermatophagoides pteronyssinus TaxID=6956 RepID=A0ABQ8IUK6_DERPT|nr:hypothetical protein DERP_012383 [Dermatophagoides pteronyssinus]
MDDQPKSFAVAAAMESPITYGLTSIIRYHSNRMISRMFSGDFGKKNTNRVVIDAYNYGCVLLLSI